MATTTEKRLPSYSEDDYEELADFFRHAEKGTQYFWVWDWERNNIKIKHEVVSVETRIVHYWDGDKGTVSIALARGRELRLRSAIVFLNYWHAWAYVTQKEIENKAA